MNYIVACYFVVVGLVGIRSLYSAHIFVRHCKRHYPAKASEFLSLGTFTLTRALFEKHDIDDVEFISLKNKAKNAYLSLTIVFFGGILVIIAIMLLFPGK